MVGKLFIATCSNHLFAGDDYGQPYPGFQDNNYYGPISHYPINNLTYVKDPSFLNKIKEPALNRFKDIIKRLNLQSVKEVKTNKFDSYIIDKPNLSIQELQKAGIENNFAIGKDLRILIVPETKDKNKVDQIEIRFYKRGTIK